MTQRKGVFVSYSRSDGDWLVRLQTVLAPLIRGESIDLWNDTKIPPGGDWADGINQAIANSRVAVLLVTPNFLASDFINTEELPAILDAHRQQGLVILWVAVSASLYHKSPLGLLQAANDPAKPLDSLSRAEQNAELVAVARKIDHAASLQAVASTLRVVDNVTAQAEVLASSDDAPSSQRPYRVVATQYGETITFRAGDEEVERITADDFDSLSEADQKVIRTHEAVLFELSDRWAEVYPKYIARDPATRKQAIEDLGQMRTQMNHELHLILGFLRSMGKSLDDHYDHVHQVLNQPLPPAQD